MFWCVCKLAGKPVFPVREGGIGVPSSISFSFIYISETPPSLPQSIPIPERNICEENTGVIVDNKCIVQSIWREIQCVLVKKILVLLTYFFFFRSFYGTNSTSSRYTGLRYVPLPEGNVSSDSDQESDEEYIPPDNVSDQESESDSNDVPSETEEEVMETDGDDDNDFAPITWQPRGSAWRMPAEASQIEKRDIKLKPEFADKITRQTEAFEILSMLFATDDYWNLVHRQTLLYITWRDMSANKRKKVKKPTMQEMKIFHGIIIYMRILRLPSRRMYWQKGTRVDQIANAMAFHRFTDISQMIHYNDNNAFPARGLPNYNPCYKIQLLIDFFPGTVFGSRLQGNLSFC